MAQPDAKPGYAGDLGPKETWELLERHPNAQLVDVRTEEEWNSVGTPDLSPLGREAILVEWQSRPQMTVNPAFVDTVAQRLHAAGAKQNTPVLFLCRSGARSRAAAMAVTAAGFGQAFNVANGFEGDPDSAGNRGKINGWKATGLPWRHN